MKPQEIVIRQATRDDMEDVFSLVKELAAYEEAPHEVSAVLDDYHENLGKVFHALVAHVDGQCVGMALYYWNFSTWKGKMLYLEDFFVQPRYRRLGIGARLFNEVLTIGREQGAALMKWQVLDWNSLAIDFYKKYDAVFEDNWLNGKFFFR